MPANGQTPPYIIIIVICALALIATVYTGTLAFCVIVGQSMNEIMGAHFSNLGNTAIGALIACLVNTRSTPQPSATDTTVTSREVTGPAPETQARPLIGAEGPPEPGK